MSTAHRIVFDGPVRASNRIVLAHGAGAGMETPFMNHFAEGLASRGIRVARFEFPYMAESRKTGKKKPPNREPKLRETWLEVIHQLGSDGLVIGGKSMGGRIASLVTDEAKVGGLVCLGYPFHPTGNPDKLRVDHLSKIKTPTLILQGERDAFGNREEVKNYKLPRRIKVRWLSDGDHSFKPRKSSGRTAEDNWDQAVEAIVAFVERIL